MNKNERLDDHQKFKQLAAAAQRGALSDHERVELNRHLRLCDSCQQVYAEYALISREGMPFLAAAYGHREDHREDRRDETNNEDWDDRPARNRLFARIAAAEQSGSAGKTAEFPRIGRPFFPMQVASRWTAAVAACAVVVLAIAAYRLGSPTRVIQEQTKVAQSAQAYDPVTRKQTRDDVVAPQTAQVSRLQLQVSAGQQEIARLRDALRAAESRSATLSTAKAERAEELRETLEQRDRLTSQLRDAQQAYQLVQAELATLRAERDRVLLRATSLESKIDELTASTRDQERRLKDDEQYLSSDRDIRELMGARKLYIADVFDVDSGSRTRNPFGRVFYTQSKSLIFYAFDLDHEPGVKSASAFQVWGQRDAESGEKSRATNLGILYLDSESNRRWVLRLDDPKQLAEVDAVFVTVEPHGGSQKPTGKPFLYALLRKEANHP
jgi:hypothetical protein